MLHEAGLPPPHGASTDTVSGACVCSLIRNLASASLHFSMVGVSDREGLSPASTVGSSSSTRFTPDFFLWLGRERRLPRYSSVTASPSGRALATCRGRERLRGCATVLPNGSRLAPGRSL